MANNAFFKFFQDLVLSGTWRKLTPSARTLYPVLAIHTDKNFSPVWPSLRRLKELSGLGNSGIASAIRSLQENGLIRVWSGKHKDGNRPNVYEFVFEYEGCQIDLAPPRGKATPGAGQGIPPQRGKATPATPPTLAPSQDNLAPQKGTNKKQRTKAKEPTTSTTIHGDVHINIDHGPKPAVVDSLRQFFTDALARELAETLDEVLKPYEVKGTKSRTAWKNRIPLSRWELERQANLIEGLPRHGNTAAALGLMDEWAVSWVAWRQGWHEEWLDYQHIRKRAAGLLDALAKIGKDPRLAEGLSREQQELGAFWRDLLDLRNTFHHHGIRPQAVVGDKKIDAERERVCAYWRGTLSRFPEIPLTLQEPRYPTVLLSPMGKSPGVLFSALRLAEAEQKHMPDLCLVVCSEQSGGMIQEAAARAGYEGEVRQLRLEDPFGGREEIDRVVNEARPVLALSGNVLVNVTGGTTLMALAAGAVAEEARRLARPTRRFGLIDRRSHADQLEAPYRVSDIFWLDPREDNDGDEGD